MIHRYWTTAWSTAEPEPLPLVGDQHVWHDDDVHPALIDLADSTAHLVYADPAQQARHRSNVVRLGLLWQFGGWWADHDLTASVPFTELPCPATARHPLGVRCNCWMAFPPEHEALDMALQTIAELPDAAPRHSTLVSGEMLLDRLWGDDVAQVVLGDTLLHEGRTGRWAGI